MEPVAITESNFKNKVLESKGCVMIDFWAEWCGPCKMMSPLIDSLVGEYSGKAEIGKVNVDENPGIAAQYGIRSIPTLIFFKDGKVVDQLIGVQPKPAIVSKLNSLI